MVMTAKDAYQTGLDQFILLQNSLRTTNNGISVNEISDDENAMMSLQVNEYILFCTCNYCNIDLH